MTSARFQPRPFSACASSLVLPSARRRRVETTSSPAPALADSACLRPERPELLGQVVRVAARRRPLVGAAVAEGRRLARAVPGAAGALLAVDLLGRVADLRLAQHRVGAGLALGQLPAHHPVQDVGARLEAEDRVVELDRPRRGRVERDHVEFHCFSLPSSGASLGLVVRRRRGRLGRGGIDRGLLGLLLPRAAPRPRRRRPPRRPSPRPRQRRPASERSAAGRITLSGAAFLTASLIVTQPPLEPGHRALDHDQPALGVGAHDLQVLGGDADRAHVAGHLLALEDLARVLALAGRAVAAVADRHAVRWPGGRRSCAASCRRRSPCRSRCRRCRRTGPAK